MAQVHLAEFPDDMYARAKALAGAQGEALGAKVFLKAWFARAIVERIERDENKARTASVQKAAK